MKRNTLFSCIASAVLVSAALPASAQTEVTVAVPNPSAITWGAIWAAIGEGYFAEEGIEVTVESVDGSPAAMQAVASGQAEIGIPGPGVFLNAAARGADAVFIYNLFPKSLFGLLVEEGDGITDVSGLKGKVIGVATSDGAEVAFARSIMSDAGMTEGEDYEFLSVGDGGPAAVAFMRGDVDAYAGPLSDAAILSSRGIPLFEVTPEEYVSYFGNGMVVMRPYLEANAEVLEGFGRAVVKGAKFMSDPANQEAALAHMAVGNPAEAENADFAAALLGRVVDRMQPLGAQAEKGLGYQPPEAWTAWHDSMVSSGELQGPIESLEALYTNQFVESWNAQ
jgi:NitT/TauT family transport system substrate-binding protein